MSAGRDAFELQAMREVARLNELIATVHERVPCPKCGAAIGLRCVRAGSRQRYAVPLEHSHAERLRAAGISLR